MDSEEGPRYTEGLPPYTAHLPSPYSTTPEEGLQNTESPPPYTGHLPPPYATDPAQGSTPCPPASPQRNKPPEYTSAAQQHPSPTGQTPAEHPAEPGYGSPQDGATPPPPEPSQQEQVVVVDDGQQPELPYPVDRDDVRSYLEAIVIVSICCLCNPLFGLVAFILAGNSIRYVALG